MARLGTSCAISPAMAATCGARRPGSNCSGRCPTRWSSCCRRCGTAATPAMSRGCPQGRRRGRADSRDPPSASVDLSDPVAAEIEGGQPCLQIGGEHRHIEQLLDHRLRIVLIGRLERLVPFAGVIGATPDQRERQHVGDLVVGEVLQQGADLVLDRLVGLVLQHRHRVVAVGRVLLVVILDRGDLRLQFARPHDQSTYRVERNRQFHRPILVASRHGRFFQRGRDATVPAPPPAFRQGAGSSTESRGWRGWPCRGRPRP
uniref:Uncharacterized protein n=1 Tax=Rhizorhabdus wittichii (strain DC-6 / KACC 16600) TaxID=1283312 RepID=X5CHQ6_RHIWD|nr:hypothetical protein [Rhizorhabdus wittichii DC-6]